MALTKIKTGGIQDDAVTQPKIAAGSVGTTELASSAVGAGNLQTASVETAKIQDQAVTLAKLPHGTSSNDGKFLRANNGADPTFESLPASGVTVSNNVDDRVVTGDGTNLNAESGLIFDGTKLGIGMTPSTGTGYILQLESGESQTFMSFGNTGTGNGALNGLVVGNDTSRAYFTQRENQPIHIATNNADRVAIDASGNVGIGNLSPDQKLKIEDSSDVAIHILKTGSQDTLIRNTGQTEICAATGGADGQRIVFKIGASTGSMSDIARFTPSGLCFGSDTAAANALDDYEEGSWSPGGSWTTISAEYIKIGRMVYAGFSLRANTTGSANVQITSLPFASANQKSAQGGIAWGLCEYNSTNNWITGFVDENTTTCILKRGGDNLTFGSGSNNMNNQAFLRGTIIYYTA